MRVKNNDRNIRGTDMKKILLGTTVLVAAGGVSASAAEWDVRVGGFMQQAAVYSGVDSDAPGSFSGVDVKSSTEIHFKPKITLDNGVEFGANVSLEGNTGGDQIDNSYAFVEGSFGIINIGSRNSAGLIMTYAAPDVGFLNLNSGDQTNYGPLHAAVAGDGFVTPIITTFLENAVRSDNAERLTYYTPRIAGFQVGASYARDSRQDSGAQVNDNAEVSNIIDIGVNYVQSFGDFDIAASGRWGTADQAVGSSATIWSTGLNLGYMGFTVGGSYAQQSGTSDVGNSQTDGAAYDLGVSYRTGPWAGSVTYFRGENTDVETDLEAIQGTVTYAMGPGVELDLTIGYTMADGGTDTAVVDNGLGTLAAGLEEDVFYVGTGVGLKF
jgi:hypothetical protein